MRKLFFVPFLFLFLGSRAQQVQESGWFASFNSIKLSAKTSLHAELQLRSTDNLAAMQTILPRFGLNYHINKSVIVTAGYAYIPSRVKVGNEATLLPEHRLWQQLIVMQPPLPKRMTLQHRFRLEERFVPKPILNNGQIEKSGTTYSTRFRYFARYIYALCKQEGAFVKGPFAALQEEVFFNITNRENVNDSWFDQNRFYAAFGYRLSAKIDLETGYMNQYIKRRSSQANLNNHIWQVAVYTRL